MRLTRAEVLLHPRRDRILGLVRAEPGIHFRELSRRAGIAAGTVRHHLTVLQRCGLVVERSHGCTMRFFDAEAGEGPWIETVLRREPALDILLDWLTANPRSPQLRVLSAMDVHGWSRSTTQHRLKRLVEGGAATVFLQGRYKLYSAALPTLPPAVQASSDSPRQADNRAGAAGAWSERFNSGISTAPVLQIQSIAFGGGPSRETNDQEDPARTREGLLGPTNGTTT